MAYVDGCILPVPTKNRDAYIEHAKVVAAVFKKHGAEKVVENWGVDVPAGEVTSFPMAVKLEDDETVVLSWVYWPSKEVRDVGMPKVMQDEVFEGFEPPFDGKRMIFAGFEVMLEI